MLKQGQPHVAVIILNWNKLTITMDCVKSVVQSDYPNISVIVVDNASKEDPQPSIQAKFPEAHFVKNSENLGYSGGNNRGADWARKHVEPDYYFILNNDTRIKEDCITKLVEVANCSKDIGVFGPLGYAYDSWDIIRGHTLACTVDWDSAGDWYPFVPLSDKKLEESWDLLDVDIIFGDGFFVRADLFDKLNGFDERFFLLHEESDFCLRSQQNGYRCAVVRQAEMQKAGGTSINQFPGLKKYFWVRNILLLIDKHHSLEDAARLRKHYLSLHRWQWRLRSKWKMNLAVLGALLDYKTNHFGACRFKRL